MLNLKRMVCMLLTAGMFTTALPVQALAASDYQYITNISLKVGEVLVYIYIIVLIIFFFFGS